MAGFCREDILMEDNDILVVHKHAGMAVQNARMGQMDLEHALLNYLVKQARAETPGQARTQIPYLAVVHRLDQPVEGVLVYAKKLDALNYYTNEMVTIPLDPTKTPQENWDGR